MKNETIEQLWNSYAAGVLPANAGEVQRQETRRAFYAGAWALLMAMFALADKTDDAGAFALEMWRLEMVRFYEDVKAGRS